jgi:hypothetical protein
MPESRTGRAWFPMLLALGALLAFTPQAGATGFEDEPYTPVEGCIATDDEYEDPCSKDEPVGCASGDYESEDPCSDEEPVKEPAPDDSESDGVRSCEDGPAGRSANESEEDVKFEDGCLPHFVRSFVRRVWKFVGEVDYYEEGVLSITLHRILNLPRKWRTEDDELLDQDATVLVSERVRVFQDGERVGRETLESANDVRVHGKLMRPFNWLEDEDGETVPTIRAKKVYVTG